MPLTLSYVRVQCTVYGFFRASGIVPRTYPVHVLYCVLSTEVNVVKDPILLCESI